MKKTFVGMSALALCGLLISAAPVMAQTEGQAPAKMEKKVEKKKVEKRHVRKERKVKKKVMKKEERREEKKAPEAK